MAEARNVGAHSLSEEATASKVANLCDLFSLLEAEQVCELIFDCLYLSDVIHFDTAMCCKKTRPYILAVLRIYMSKVFKCNPTIEEAQIDWLIARKITIERCKLVQINEESFKKLFNSNIVKSLVYLDLFDVDITDEDDETESYDGIIIAKNCRNLEELYVNQDYGNYGFNPTNKSLSLLAKTVLILLLSILVIVVLLQSVQQASKP